MKKLLEECRGWYRSSRGRLAYAGIAAACALTLYACGGSDDAPPPSELAVQRVFAGLTFASPVAMLQAPGDGSRWFVVEQSGVVRVFANDQAATSSDVFLDIRDRVDGTGEMGLLGMAFHPGFPGTPRVYLSYTNETSGRVSRVSEFMLNSSGNVNPASERIILTINQPATETNHKGGNIAFGPDGFLYIGMGDGGGSNDGGAANSHGPIGNAQNMMTLLGKMLRIDVNGTLPYEIPAGNAFTRTNPLCGTSSAGGTGTLNCPEIYASGFRNPWRWSFDRQRGDLWVGDVGQGAREEIDRVVAGGNYGWRCFEGTLPVGLTCGSEPNRLPPVAEYGRSEGRSVTGGYVYRGTAIGGLHGRYVFGDFITGRIWYISIETAPTAQIVGGSASGLSISSFGQDVDGELYLVHYHATSGALYRLTAP
ncbi:MAG TPA: PQQ-dependent sugar dehydrogenase [Burkholderiales bacterium]|jgi:glucose/arabinose dehydrogenase|nr:PQQ-dependent sugar dehydrogenase [Burkholderiales bacterium]